MWVLNTHGADSERLAGAQKPLGLGTFHPCSDGYHEFFDILSG